MERIIRILKELFTVMHFKMEMYYAKRFEKFGPEFFSVSCCHEIAKEALRPQEMTTALIDLMPGTDNYVLCAQAQRGQNFNLPRSTDLKILHLISPVYWYSSYSSEERICNYCTLCRLQLLIRRVNLQLLCIMLFGRCSSFFNYFVEFFFIFTKTFNIMKTVSVML